MKKIDSNTSLQELFEIAKKTVNELNEKEEFLVKSLFRGFEWERIKKGDRTKLGSLFFNYAKNEAVHDIEVLGKTAQNQQKYKKI